MTTRRAACSCGALSITTEGEPVRISMCHCLACQRRTGSTFGAQARWPESSTRIEGASTEYARTGDSGGTIRFHFCPTCGSTVFYRLDGLAGFVAVPIGAFADPSFPAPTISIYEARKHGWTGLPAAAEHMD